MPSTGRSAIDFTFEQLYRDKPGVKHGYASAAVNSKVKVQK
jgi:hypothetical protein